MLLFAGLGCTGTVRDAADSERAAEHRDNDESGSDPDQSGANGMAGSGGSSADPDDPDDPAALDCDALAIDPGPSPMRLLTRAQYLSTVHDLFGEVSGLEAALGPATEASAFGLLQPDVTQVELEGFQSAAELIAASVVQNDSMLDGIAPCAEDAEPESCARAAIERLGARAYRAPLTSADDIDRHLALFGAGATTSYARGIELLLRGMLQAPRFLYRVEVGTSEAVSEQAVKLSPHEVAARLSYLVWGTLPDDLLIEAAEDGALDTQDGVSDQLTRMLKDARGKELMRRFLEGVVHLSELETVVKDPEMFPQWEQSELRDALRAQARGFFDHVLYEEGGSLRALLTSRTVLVSDALSDYYDVTAGAGFEPFELDAEQASGLLTLPALLARLAKPDESSPIYRGKFVREVLLCQQLPAPPANVPKPPEVEAGVSTRERLRQHEEDAACRSCHQLLDPIGFTFERFDAIGRYRTMDGGDAVDARGELIGTLDADGAIDGVAALGERLAGSVEVEECMARQWFRYALSRFEQDPDACSMQRLMATFRDAGQDLNTLPQAIVATDAFRYRRPIDVTELSP